MVFFHQQYFLLDSKGYNKFNKHIDIDKQKILILNNAKLSTIALALIALFLVQKVYQNI